jgi:hypothetical protein
MKCVYIIVTNIWLKTRDNLLSEPYGLCSTLFVLAVISGGLGAKLVGFIFPIYPSVAIAAITEPITTKFLPAYISLHLADSNAQQRFLNRPVLFGAWGGISFGLAERVLYAISGADPLLLWTVSVGLHGVFGILAAGVVYWRGLEPWNKSDSGIILLGISAAISIHLVWNTVIV